MKITAICNTYRRHELLEEALQSFLMQDYAGEKELIILNDEPEQTLAFTHPQVRIINMSTRAPNLATKHNFAVSIATGQFIVPWDDDDIFLPHHLSTIAANQKNGIWYSDTFFTDTSTATLRHTTGKIHCNHAYNQQAFIRFGAYHDTADQSFDFILMNMLRSAGIIPPAKTPPSYIYRKNSTPSENYSAHYTGDPAKTMARHATANPTFTPGKINLNPHWTQNWQALATNALDTSIHPIPLHQIDAHYKPPLKLHATA